MYGGIFESPIGLIFVNANQDAIIGLEFVENLDHIKVNENEVIKHCFHELEAYFKGDLKKFSVNCFQEGTVFQKKVWTALCDVNYGDVASYKDIAIAAGSPKAVRAVGNTNNKNKISIIIPCHRIIGSNNSLVGYGGSLWRKQWLLSHEGGFIKNEKYYKTLC